MLGLRALRRPRRLGPAPAPAVANRRCVFIVLVLFMISRCLVVIFCRRRRRRRRRCCGGGGGGCCCCCCGGGGGGCGCGCGGGGGGGGGCCCCCCCCCCRCCGVNYWNNTRFYYLKYSVLLHDLLSYEHFHCLTNSAPRSRSCSLEPACPAFTPPVPGGPPPPTGSFRAPSAWCFHERKRKVKPRGAFQSLSETFPCTGYTTISLNGTTLSICVCIVVVVLL